MRSSSLLIIVIYIFLDVFKSAPSCVIPINLTTYSTDITFHLGNSPYLSWDDAVVACEIVGMRLVILSTPIMMTAAIDFVREQA